MQKTTNNMLVFFIILALSILSNPHQTLAQKTEIPRTTTLDPKEATVRFVKLFDETCVQYRNSLGELKSRAVDGGWKEFPGPFPYRHDEQNNTALIVWGLWLGGVPYQIGLSVFDDTSPAITCTLLSAIMDKSSLVDKMIENPGRTIRKRLRLGEQDLTLFDTLQEKQLRIGCSTAVPKQVWVGQCSLVVVQDQDTPKE